MENKDLKTVRKFRPKDEPIFMKLINKVFDWLKAPQWFTFERKIDESKAQEEYIRIISKLIVEARESIHIVGNENCFPVWNNKTIADAIRASGASEITIIVCGTKPILNIEDINLLKSTEKNIRIYYSSDLPELHFITTDNSVLIEAEHDRGEHTDKAIFCTGSDIINEVYKNEANRLKIEKIVYVQT
ncbi:MAG: hypothetical protein WC788_08320 [Candidatus Paceibacterota bacterium]|jgi:hypothetical protein